MEDILNLNKICDFLGIPSVPKKKWDGATSFKDGVATIQLSDGTMAYAVATFDAETDTQPRIKKTFSLVPFSAIVDIYVVPSYMDKDIDDMDLDDDSKAAAKEILNQATMLEEEHVDETPQDMPEWVFDEIHNIDEARAWIKSYRKKKKIRGGMPKSEEGIKAYLLVIKANQKRNLK